MQFGETAGLLAWSDASTPFRSGRVSCWPRRVELSNRSKDGMKNETRQMTIQELMQAIQDIARSDEEVVAVFEHMLRTGRVLRPTHAAAPA